MISFLHVSNQTLYELLFSSMHVTSPAHLIILTLFGVEYKLYAPHYAILLSLLLPHPSWTQTTSSTSHSHTPSSHVHSWFLTNFWPIPLPTQVSALLLACILSYFNFKAYFLINRHHLPMPERWRRWPHAS